MSEEMVSKLLLMAEHLLGVIVGGLISFFTARGIEHQRRRRERQEQLTVLRRDALAAVLEWIEPMRNAENRASMMVMAAIRGEFDHDKFLVEFPYLLWELVKKDLPANQRAVLPDNVYSRGHQIVRELDDLRYLGVKYGSEAVVMGKLMAGFQECSDKLNAIGKQISELETDVRKEFRKTFE
jgi:hypothetical protein